MRGFLKLAAELLTLWVLLVTALVVGTMPAALYLVDKGVEIAGSSIGIAYNLNRDQSWYMKCLTVSGNLECRMMAEDNPDLTVDGAKKFLPRQRPPKPDNPQQET